jgi:hypothetical protein
MSGDILVGVLFLGLIIYFSLVMAYTKIVYISIGLILLGVVLFFYLIMKYTTKEDRKRVTDLGPFIWSSNMDGLKKHWKKYLIIWFVVLILALYFLTNR